MIVLVAGCSAGSGSEDAEQGATSPGPTTSGGDATAESPSAPSPSEQPTPYRPHPAEADGAVKRVAARAVEQQRRVRQVTYTQYFGYAPPAASILVEADYVDGGGATYDVRLTEGGDGWTVDSVTAADPAPPAGDPGRVARRVLDSDRIDLNWAGRADVEAGLVADSVLRSMLAVARDHRIEISVLAGAHPVNVFGTDRRSDHPDGLAYDIGRIDGRLVVEPRARALVREVMREAAATGAYQVGGPEDLDCGGSAYFSDETHSEHVHVG